jgi:glucose-1-phosphate thymidylyltransferase
LAAAQNSPLLAAYDLNDLEAAKRFGVVVPGTRHSVQAFQEKPAEPQSTLVSTGCLYFPARLLRELTDFSRQKNDDLGGIFEHFLRIGERVEYFPFQEKWFDIGSFAAYLDAQKYLIGERVLNDGAILKGNVECSGTVYLGAGAVVEDAVLADAIIESGSQVRDACIRNAVLAENTTVRGVDLSGVSLRAESFVAAE